MWNKRAEADAWNEGGALAEGHGTEPRGLRGLSSGISSSETVSLPRRLSTSRSLRDALPSVVSVRYSLTSTWRALLRSWRL